MDEGESGKEIDTKRKKKLVLEIKKTAPEVNSIFNTFRHFHMWTDEIEQK